MKKNQVAGALAAVLLAAGTLAGCGSTNGSTETATSQAATQSATQSAAQTASETASEAATQDASEAATEAATETAAQEESDDVTVRVGALKGPTAMGLVNLMSESDAGTSEGKYEFTIEAAPDAIVPLIASGDLDIALIPGNLASVLYHKTEGGISVIDINTEGVLYCVTGDDTIDSFDDLDGKTIVTTGQGATPEYAIRYLLDAYGITADLDFHSEATEIASILAEDSSTVAILPQPFATAAAIKNQDVHEAFSLNDSWNDIADGKSSMVQGVTIVNNDFLAAHPAAVETFLKEQKASVEKAADDAAGTAELVASYGIVEKAAIAEKALPKCAIVCVTGEEMKTKLSGFLDILAGFDKTSVGGSVPGDDFYYLGK